MHGLSMIIIHEMFSIKCVDLIRRIRLSVCLPKSLPACLSICPFRCLLAVDLLYRDLRGKEFSQLNIETYLHIIILKTLN